MGQRVIRFSDLSGETIDDDGELVRIVVREHPDLDGGPVEIEALAGELKDIDDNALDLVTFELHHSGKEPETIVMEAERFDRLATGSPMAAVLSTAKRVTTPVLPQSRPAAARPRIDYSSLEHAGTPHKGRTTDAEKQVVRDHFDEVNERLAAQGVRTIDLDNPDHVNRYGLERLVGERSAGIEQITEPALPA